MISLFISFSHQNHLYSDFLTHCDANPRQKFTAPAAGVSKSSLFYSLFDGGRGQTNGRYKINVFGFQLCAIFKQKWIERQFITLQECCYFNSTMMYLLELIKSIEKNCWYRIQIRNKDDKGSVY